MERNGIYKCEICGNVVELEAVGGGQLVCCEQPMNLMKENTVEASTEKHIPVVEKIENGFKVVVGSVEHPMEEKHYIEWIEVFSDGVCLARQYLKPGEKPEVVFNVEKVDKARAYCNLHGLWSK
jgi:superoxide reductase